MIVWIKIGTFSAQKLSAPGVRRLRVGDVFEVKESRERYAKKMQVRLLDTKMIDGETLYFVERW
jgi:hypothetical protein